MWQLLLEDLGILQVQADPARHSQNPANAIQFRLDPLVVKLHHVNLVLDNIG